MGDISSSPRPGIMLVRPSLHSKSEDNEATFRRWTALHFRDLLNCPPSSPSFGLKGITRALRYTNDAGDLLYTIHADDIGIWKTQPYYEISRRLDLENTRALGEDEEGVLKEGCGFGEGAMVWNVVDARFGIFEEYLGSRVKRTEGEIYQHISTEALQKPSEDSVDGAPPGCTLLTLTYTSVSSDEWEDERLPRVMKELRDKSCEILCELYGIAGFMYSGFYRERQDAQPDLHPRIWEGEDGNGSWVGCFYVEGVVDEGERQRFCEGVELEVGSLREEHGEGWNGWDVKVGVWRGDLFVV